MCLCGPLLLLLLLLQGELNRSCQHFQYLSIPDTLFVQLRMSCTIISGFIW